MVYEKKQLIPVFCLTLLAGIGLHALYRLCPNALTALFSPCLLYTSPSPRDRG